MTLTDWERLCRERLAITYTPEGVELYMTARNRLMHDQVPMDLIRRGEGGRVFEVIERIEGGAK